MEGEAFGSHVVAGTSDYIPGTETEGEREERRVGGGKNSLACLFHSGTWLVLESVLTHQRPGFRTHIFS